MFDIAFIRDEPPYEDEEGRTGPWGFTQPGAGLRKRFIAPNGEWTWEDYERQWIEGARRLLDGARESAFVLESGRLWWTARLEFDIVVVQQRLLIGDKTAPAWSANAAHVPYDLVGERSSRTEEGEADGGSYPAEVVFIGIGISR